MSTKWADTVSKLTCVCIWSAYIMVITIHHFTGNFPLFPAQKTFYQFNVFLMSTAHWADSVYILKLPALDVHLMIIKIWNHFSNTLLKRPHVSFVNSMSTFWGEAMHVGAYECPLITIWWEHYWQIDQSIWTENHFSNTPLKGPDNIMSFHVILMTTFLGGKVSK